jgi:hypothetical protein
MSLRLTILISDYDEVSFWYSKENHENKFLGDKHIKNKFNIRTISNTERL